jgi:drug/metabolite transporter (DMT)-like permease
MNWIISSAIMYISSVALYLLVRKSSKLGNPSQFNNLAMFFVPLIILLAVDSSTNQNFMLSVSHFVVIILAGILFSYLGNVFSLISIELAPNPGYSLVISKSYVVFTTLVAVLFFQAELTLKKAVAIAIIVGFSGLIMLSQKALNKTKNKLWLPLAIGAFFCWGLLSLTSKYLFNQGVSVYAFLTYAYITVSLCIVFEMLKKRISFGIIRKDPVNFLLIGLFSTGFNFFLFEAIRTSPNVGYVNAINASSISAVTILAIILFKDEFSKIKFIGILGVTFGLLLLLI